MAEGWHCPNCGKAHAPHVHTCPEPARMVAPDPWPTVLPDYMRGIEYDPCSGCKGACGNVACPKRLVITC